MADDFLSKLFGLNAAQPRDKLVGFMKFCLKSDYELPSLSSGSSSIILRILFSISLIYALISFSKRSSPLFDALSSKIRLFVNNDIFYYLLLSKNCLNLFISLRNYLRITSNLLLKSLYFH